MGGIRRAITVQQHIGREHGAAAWEDNVLQDLADSVAAGAAGWKTSLCEMIQCLCENRRPQGRTSAERGLKRKRWCEVIGRDKGS